MPQRGEGRKIDQPANDMRATSVSRMLEYLRDGSGWLVKSSELGCDSSSVRASPVDKRQAGNPSSVHSFLNFPPQAHSLVIAFAADEDDGGYSVVPA
ncbi:unnamed protein product [Soboliphyme baturini]|uniref:Transcriptional regulator n=1 Tax=Soboliphyme baturini TaxID=241478 RepID=A0A183IVG9_9BILA|nr:unnamed protein product [Soboliphyme baturini]